jgi:hypothetical protein
VIFMRAERSRKFGIFPGKGRSSDSAVVIDKLGRQTGKSNGDLL